MDDAVIHLDQSCVVGAGDAERKRLRRRMAAGKVVSPYRGVFVDATFWNSLTPPLRMACLAEGLTRSHPHWVFAGLTAAALLGLDYTWALLRDGTVTIAVHSTAACTPTRTPLRRIHMSRLVPCEVRIAVAEVGETLVQVTPPARTLVDCALRYPFRLVLGMFDSAFRRGLTTPDAVTAECHHLRTDRGPVRRLLRYADARSENGGESLCRGTLIDYGFAVPGLQHEFTDPEDARNRRRVDFVWHAPDGRVVVLEYDGTRKYVDPEMTDRRGIQQVVADERARDAMLLRAGVAKILHVTYDDVAGVAGLIRKLEDGRVPRAGLIPFYERV